MDKLPENWCIKGTHTQVLEYATKNGVMPPYTNKENYYHFPSFSTNWGGHGTSSRSIENGYTEITFNQFKRWVLKEDKKVMGYRAPHDLFKGRIKAGEIFSEYSQDKFVMYSKNHTTSGVPTEIVENWKAVYESEFKEGDWVRWEGVNPVTGKVIGKSSNWTDCYKLDVNGNLDTHDSCNVKHLRFATPEEVRIAQNKTLPEIGGKKGKDLGKSIKYGCTEMNKSYIKRLYTLLREDVSIESVNISTTIVSMGKLKDVVDYINENKD